MIHPYSTCKDLLLQDVSDILHISHLPLNSALGHLSEDISHRAETPGSPFHCPSQRAKGPKVNFKIL